MTSGLSLDMQSLKSLFTERKRLNKVKVNSPSRSIRELRSQDKLLV